MYNKRELIKKAAESIYSPTDNLRERIIRKIGLFRATTGRAPSIIKLTRKQLKEVENLSYTPVVANINTATIFGIPIAESNKFGIF